MTLFEEVACEVFERVYSDADAQRPDDIVHVSCSGYVSPSPVQSFLSRRRWLNTGVTHSYHMGCYGAFPAIRTAVGLVGSSYASLPTPKRRVDLVHTEFLSLHFDLLGDEPDNFVTSTLFADGFIKYAAYPQSEFVRQRAKRIEDAGHRRVHSSRLAAGDDVAARTAAVRHVAIEESTVHDPRLDRRFRRVDLRVRSASISSGKNPPMVFAIHPGGPAILNQIRSKLGIEESQIAMSRKVLLRAREHGLGDGAAYLADDRRIAGDPRGLEGVEHGVRPGLDGNRRPLRESLGPTMATTPAAKPQKFSVPAPFYWGVTGVHAAAPLFVVLGNLETKMLAAPARRANHRPARLYLRAARAPGRRSRFRCSASTPTSSPTSTPIS